MKGWTLGIDFGTSYTTAAARANDQAEVIEIDGDRRIPSVIMVDDDGHLVVGRAADNQAAAHPGRVVREPKRLIGEPAPVVLGGRPYPITTLVGALLEHVFDQAVEYAGSAPSEVRLTHPATWRRPRLRALADAAREAGISSPVFVPEPVAAAIAYAADSAPLAGHVAIYDLGGGTFDTAVLEVREHGFVVKGRPGGDGRLGGEFFDELLANHLGARFPAADWDALQVSDDLAWRQARAGYRDEVRKAKEGLSLQRRADLVVGLPTGLQRLSVTREEFESLVRPYLTEANDLLATTIADAGIAPSDLAAIFLVGGASRIPLAERLLTAAFAGVPISRRGDPKMVVALGATHPDAAAASGAPIPAAAASTVAGGTIANPEPPTVAAGTVTSATLAAGETPILPGEDTVLWAGAATGPPVVGAAATVLAIPGGRSGLDGPPPTLIDPPTSGGPPAGSAGGSGRSGGDAPTDRYSRFGRPLRPGRNRRPLAVLLGVAGLIVLLAAGVLGANLLSGTSGASPSASNGGVAAATGSPTPSDSPSASPSASASQSPSFPVASPSDTPVPSVSLSPKPPTPKPPTNHAPSLNCTSLSTPVLGVYAYYKLHIQQSCFSDPDGDAFTIYAKVPTVGSIGSAPQSDCNVGQTCWRYYPKAGWDGTPYNTNFTLYAQDTHGAKSSLFPWELCLNTTTCP